MMGFFAKDIGIDLGTANTLVHLKGKGIIIREPSVVAIDKYTGQVVAVGTEAKEMLGRTPENLNAIRPLKDGVIADFTATRMMLKHLVEKACQRYVIARPRVVVCVPSGVTEVEERAVEEATINAGAWSESPRGLPVRSAARRRAAPPALRALPDEGPPRPDSASGAGRCAPR